MATRRGEARRPYGSLSADEILDAAEEIAATEGTAGLTLRRLGTALNVTHTAIYRHFRDKDDLLDAVADRLLDRRAAPMPGTDWRDTLNLQLRHGVGRYEVHPDLAQLIALRPNASTALAATMERALAALEDLGLSSEDAAAMFQVMESFVVGFGLYSSLESWAVAEGRMLDDDAERRAIAALPAERYPHVAKALPHLFEDRGTVLERGIEVLLDAVERLAAGQDGSETQIAREEKP